MATVHRGYGKLRSQRNLHIIDLMIKKKKIYLFYLYLFCGIALAGFALQISSFSSLQGQLWGFHFYSFLNPAFIVFSGVLIIGAAVWLFVLKQEKSAAFRENILIRHQVATAVGFAILMGIIFWMLRSKQLLLGDSLPLTLNLPKGQDFHPRQPLTMWLQHFLFSHIGPLFFSDEHSSTEIARLAVSAGSVAAGVVYAYTACSAGRFFAKSNRLPVTLGWLAAAVLLSQGYVQLFSGYVENYTFYSLALFIYLYTSLRFLMGKSRLLLPGLALILAISLHLSGAVLIPSFLVLSVFALKTTERRKAGLIDLSLSVLAFAALHLIFIRVWEYNLPASLFDISTFAIRQEEEFMPGYLYSWQHLNDFLNHQFLIGPFSLFAFLPAAYIAVRKWGREKAVTVFILTTGLAYFAVSLLANDSNLGYARNWDLLAPAGICFTTLAVFLIFKHFSGCPYKIRRLLIFAAAVSILHTLPWLWINHDRQLALERFKTLPLGMGRTELVVANHYLGREQPDEAVQWLRRSLKRNPENGPAHAMLGMILADQGNFEDASEHYARAVKLREDKIEYRNNYMMTLLELGRQAEVAEQLDILTDMKPEVQKYWAQLAGVFVRMDGAGGYRHSLEKFLASNRARMQSVRGNETARVKACACLVILNRDEEAALLLRHLLDAGIQNGHAAAFLAAVYKDNQHLPQAEELYSAALQLMPDNILYRNIYVSVLMELEKYESALKQLKILSEVESEREKSLETAADLLIRLGRRGEASELYRELLQINQNRLEQNPDDLIAHIKAATCLMMLNRGDQAVRHFKRALEIDPRSMAALFNLGSALLNMGRTEEAGIYLSRFIELYPGHPRAEWVRQQLEIIQGKNQR